MKMAIRIILIFCMGGVMVSQPVTGRGAEAWTVATDDTKLTVGITNDGHLCIYELSNPSAGWNWAPEPSIFNLMDNVTVNGKVCGLCL